MERCVESAMRSLNERLVCSLRAFPLSSKQLGLVRRSAAKQTGDQADRKQDQENKEQGSRDLNGDKGDPAKSQHARDKRNNKESQCPLQHRRVSSVKHKLPQHRGSKCQRLKDREVPKYGLIKWLTPQQPKPPSPRWQE